MIHIPPQLNNILLKEYDVNQHARSSGKIYKASHNSGVIKGFEIGNDNMISTSVTWGKIHKWPNQIFLYSACYSVQICQFFLDHSIQHVNNTQYLSSKSLRVTIGLKIRSSYFFK